MDTWLEDGIEVGGRLDWCDRINVPLLLLLLLAVTIGSTTTGEY